MMPVGIIIVLVFIALVLMANAFMAGYTYGLYKSLFVKKPEPQKEEEPKYNPSMVGYLPAEVQQYYQQTNGQNIF
jgi:hypothetical protein